MKPKAMLAAAAFAATCLGATQPAPRPHPRLQT
jgi:hypothetical protein